MDGYTFKLELKEETWQEFLRLMDELEEKYKQKLFMPNNAFDVIYKEKKMTYHSVPTPHGRLIDATVFREKLNALYESSDTEQQTALSQAIEALEETPCVIDAEQEVTLCSLLDS